MIDMGSATVAGTPWDEMLALLNTRPTPRPRSSIGLRVEKHLGAMEADGVVESVKEPGRKGRKLYLLAPAAEAHERLRAPRGR